MLAELALFEVLNSSTMLLLLGDCVISETFAAVAALAVKLEWALALANAAAVTLALTICCAFLLAAAAAAAADAAEVGCCCG